MTSNNNSPAENTAILAIAGSAPATKTRKKRVGKVQLPDGSEACLAAHLFHPVKAVQKDLFRYLVCHRREFCIWLKQEYAGNLQKQPTAITKSMIFRQEKLFDGMAGFTICVLSSKTSITSAQPVRIISSHPFVALPPAHAQFKVIPVEVIFKSLQEVLGLSQVISGGAGLSRKTAVSRIQTKEISLTQGAKLLGVAERTVSRIRVCGHNSYNWVDDYQVFFELLSRSKRKIIAVRYGISERTVRNIYLRVMESLLQILLHTVSLA